MNLFAGDRVEDQERPLVLPASEDGHVIGRNIWTGDRQQVGPYDSFVYAYGGIRVDTLSEPLKEKGISVETVGDAFSPRTLQHAILEGHKSARSI